VPPPGPKALISETSSTVSKPVAGTSALRVAIAHKILVAIYPMLSQQVSYNDLGDLYLDTRNKNHLTRKKGRDEEADVLMSSPTGDFTNYASDLPPKWAIYPVSGEQKNNARNPKQEPTFLCHHPRPT